MKESPHSFKLDFPDDYADPTIPVSKAIHIGFYPQYRPEFFETISECAKMIDKLQRTETKIQYTNQLNRIFIVRHKTEAMKLFRRLVALTT